jgi:hypothetical protein
MHSEKQDIRENRVIAEIVALAFWEIGHLVSALSSTYN